MEKQDQKKLILEFLEKEKNLTRDQLVKKTRIDNHTLGNLLMILIGKNQVEVLEVKDDTVFSLVKPRQAKCCYCGSLEPSEVNLPFFKETPESETDEFYNGCRGWD